jgi:L-ascorbate metabolism protein UlaG (beta-lactamase superfamily)
MKITKYEHACFTVEEQGKLLIVDPGSFTKNLESPENVVAIVVTHEHPDHFDVTALGALIAHNPNAVVVAHEAITKQLGEALPYKTVTVGETVDFAPFQLEFFGGNHATIYPSIPVIANLGVMINDKIYYPGDSFVLPERPIDTLALPVAAPWLKLSEAIDFATAVTPRIVFPTHDAILSDIGKAMLDRMLPGFIEKAGGSYQRIDSQSIEL